MTIELQYKYLKYDVDQWMMRIGESRVGEQNAKLRNLVQTGGSESDRNLIHRLCEQGVARLVTLWHEHMTVAHIGEGNAGANDVLDKEREKWRIHIDWSEQQHASVIAEQMHRFVLSYMLSQLCSLFGVERADTYIADMLDAKNALDETMEDLDKPMKRRPRKIRDEHEDRVTIIEDNEDTITIEVE